MGHANNSFTSTNGFLTHFRQRPDQSGCGYGHSARELPLRLGWRAGGIEILISSSYIVSSKVGHSEMPALIFMEGYMSKKSVRPATRLQPSRQQALDFIGPALEKSDIAPMLSRHSRRHPSLQYL